MLKIARYLEEKILENLNKRKILIIYGARQTGKTTLVRTILKRFENSFYLNGDLTDDQDKLKETSLAMLEQFKNYDLLVIDEAQRIKDIGIKLKVIFDALPELKIIATGSSAFELSNVVNEPLTGRYFSFTLYPISFAEADKSSKFNLEQLVYGSYPEVVMTPDAKTKEVIIKNIASNYLFKDVLNIEYIKNARSLEHLLKALALQIGGQVSTTELADTLDIDAKTVLSYLDILRKLHIVFPLPPYFSNKRKSISKMRKYFFYDLGIRNAVISDFTPIGERNDAGQLWENFCIVERMKRSDNLSRAAEYYFWRSYQGEEIDLIETENRAVGGFEFKWAKTAYLPKIEKIYKEDLSGQGDLQIISRDNFKPFLAV
ncbi:MAG: ATP-binding protein [Candidatus Paceibacterota bacterium]